MALQPGQLFGNYRLVRLIGEGGFGEVYLAENPLIERRAAVKVLHSALAQDTELVRRFLNEARAASAIRHPNIIEVFDAGSTPEGAPYILMEFLEGASLQKRLADVGRLALPQALEIASQAGSALAAAHAAGIVHRDLKPENLFLIPDAGTPTGERVKVLDFGIAKIRRGGISTGGTVRTQSGLIMGSPAYMSPEQCKDSADVDLRSDVYSFATIVYEMLAGRTPYVAASGTELLVMHLTETPRPLRELIGEVPAYVESAVARALARAREDRYDSITSFLGALRGNLSGGTAILSQPTAQEAPPATTASPARRVERTALLPVATTFSRATGEVGAEASDKTLPASSRSRRWMPLALVGVAVAALAIFLLARPSHDSAPRATTGAASTANAPSAVADPAESTGQKPPVNADPVAVVVPPSKADAGAPPTAVVEALPGMKPAHADVASTAGGTSPTTKRGRADARQSNPSRAIKKKSEEEKEWIGH